MEREVVAFSMTTGRTKLNKRNVIMKDSLGLKLEHAKRLSNLRFQLLESVYDRRSIAEGYVDGDIVIHVHGLASDHRFCATWRRGDSDSPSNNCEVPVFVVIRKYSEPLRPLASVTRLQPLDHCNMLVADTFEIGVSVSLEVIYSIINRKLRVLDDLLGIKLSQVINEVIQGRTQIVDDFPNENADDKRNRGIGRDFCRAKNSPFDTPVRELEHLWFALNDNVITYGFTDDVSPTVQIRQVFACPCNPLISAIERLHMLYSTQKAAHTRSAAYQGSIP